MEGFLNLIYSKINFGGRGYICAVYIGEDSSILGTMKCLVPFWDGEWKRAPLKGESWEWKGHELNHLANGICSL